MKKSIRARGFAPALSVLALAVTASVQAQVLEVNPVVVSATRMAQPLSDVLSSVSVITRQEIEKSPAQSLVDLLQGEPGIEYGRNGGPGSQTSIFLRGQASNDLVVLVDGVRTQTDGGGFLTMTDMPLAQIERIEILRGNAGALYGEAAVGGVINIYTRQQKGEPSAYGFASYGSKNTAEINAGFGGVQSDYKFDVNAGRKDSKGFSAMDPAQSARVNPDRDGYSSEYMAAKLDKRIDADLNIGFRFRTHTSDVDYDAKTNPDYSNSLPTDVHRSLKKTDATGVYARRQMSDAWTSTLDFSNAVTSYEEFKNGAGNGRYNSQQNALHWGNSYQIDATAAASFGADLINDKHEEFSKFMLDRRTTAGFVGLTKKLDKLTLQANARRDLISIDHRDASGVNNLHPNASSSLLGVGYQLNNTWKLTATNSSGFRAPSATEISNNSNLTQEKFKSNEVGAIYASVETVARVAYFQTNTTNAIDWFQDAGGHWNVMNAGEVENKGIETSLRSNWMGNSVKLSAVKQDPVNVSGAYPLGRRAKRYGSVDISRNLANYEVGAKLYASSARPNFNEVNSDMLAGYSLWSFYASRKVNDSWTARVKLENAFNRHYELAGGYNTPGRGIFATLSYQAK